jgi:cytoskeletal protein CcmA (bactofilin family)
LTSQFAHGRLHGAGVVTKSLPDTLNRDHPAGSEHDLRRGTAKQEPLRFPVPHDNVTTRLLRWIRGIVQSNHEVVDAVLFKALLAGTSVKDAEPILWQVEVALKDAERPNNALALTANREQTTMSKGQNQPGTPSLSSREEPTLSSTPMAASHEVTTMRSSYVSAGSSTADDRATIGKTLQIKGEVIGSESLYIDGKVEGAITLPDSRVTVSRNAQVSANITAREVVVLGKVSGNIYASDRVDIRSEGSLTGDVTGQRISIADGAFFKGGIDISKLNQVKVGMVPAEISSNDLRRIPIAVTA